MRRTRDHRLLHVLHGGLPMFHVHIAGGPWSSPTFGDSNGGDQTGGDDPMVRYAAASALGPYNGSVVVVDPDTGRVLTIVNQKLALGGGFQPCSTIKLVTGLAGLGDGIIQADSLMRTSDRSLANRSLASLTRAFEYSSNRYFSAMGKELGYDRFMAYARKLGLGEKAGLNIAGESPGLLPPAPPTDEEGGMGMMSSFGLDIAVTPLQLAALTSAVANDGTLYYLQYPRTQREVEHFVPRVKRHLDVTGYLPAIQAGMFGVVAVGTGRRANGGPENPVYGKTGTCTDARFATHLGWFASFNRGLRRSVAVVVLLTGGRPVNGGFAASIAGAVYRTLQQDDYFGTRASVADRASLR